MGKESKKSENRVESEGTVEERNSTKKKKKKKSREKKDSFGGENGETAAFEGEKLGEGAPAKKISEKKRVNSEADDDGVKKSKKSKKRADSGANADDGGEKSEKKRVDSEDNADDGGKKLEKKWADSEANADDGGKKSEKKRADSEAEDGEKKSKKKSKEKMVDSEAEDDGVKKSKKRYKEKSVDSEAESDGVKKSKKKKKSKKESGGDEIGNSEESQSDGKRETGKRKRDEGGLGAEENTENSDKETNRKSKKKKPCVNPEVEEEMKDSAKDAKKKQSEDSEAEGNDLNSTKDAKKKRKKKKQSEDPEAEENNNDSTQDAKKKQNSEAGENDLNSTKDAKKKGKKKKKQREDPESEENNKEEATKKRKKKCSKSDENVTTPSSKSTKKVKFSDQVEVFPAEDEESEEEEQEEEEEEGVELVRGNRFTKEEDELIKKAVLEYVDNHALGDEGVNMIMNCRSHPQIRGCWKEITAALPWRPHSGVYHRAHTLFEEGSKGVWTKEDFDMLIEYHKKHGSDWKALADAMGKHRRHVKDAWRRVRMASKKKKGHWSRQEYQTLFELVNKDIRMKAFQEKRSKHGMLRDNIPWMAISDQLETRDHTICCVKWYDQLQSPMVAKGIWANVDDYRLMDELTNLDAACVDDVDWDNLLDNRDGEACRKRWDQMVRNIGFPGTKTFAEQVEILSERYCPDLAEDREDFDNRPFDPED
ncbi:hypothetical protein EUTSA_v10027663mg [Eutrema salsugineum]|uniref:Myb-like domain-containing protein n=1 Tax=Eutrema salsugineum TaxID=72664 RepID=V4M3N1_EUTSA|nr:ABC transporter F family member 4 [Eutrema salsugineum]ESQ46858.1 hypothetical protein EUTSA_v10027663mg [Eutrema salsugineum]